MVWVCWLQDEVDLCCICLEGMVTAAVVLKLKCGHRMHRDCLAPWVRKKGACVCPTCKQESHIM